MATAHKKPDLRDEGLYETDFYAWTHDQAALIREGRISELDLVSIREEIESLGRREKRELVDMIVAITAELLKWQVQPNGRGRPWMLSLALDRRCLGRRLAENPSLAAELASEAGEFHDDAVLKAMIATGLDRSLFPATFPFTFDQLVDPDFLPGEL